MDEDEEAGLRSFALTVGSYAGASSPESPRWIERAGKRQDIAEIESRWREEERLGFRVRLTGGDRLLLYYVPELDLWSGVVMVASRVRERAPGEE